MEYIKIKVHKDYDRWLTCQNPQVHIYHLMVHKGEAVEGSDEVEAVIASLVGKPSLEQIKDAVMGWIDQQTDQRILTGCTFEGHLVWLSAENQLNYKAAYDLAMQFQGAHGTLPLTFKLGTTEEPVYREFKTLEDLTAFYLSVVSHKTACLTEGWRAKDNIDWGRYEQG